jgi:hypothetical protein
MEGIRFGAAWSRLGPPGQLPPPSRGLCPGPIEVMDEASSDRTNCRRGNPRSMAFQHANQEPTVVAVGPTQSKAERQERFVPGNRLNPAESEPGPDTIPGTRLLTKPEVPPDRKPLGSRPSGRSRK